MSYMDKIQEEHQRYKAVLLAAGYPNLDKYQEYSIEFCIGVGKTVKERTIEALDELVHLKIQNELLMEQSIKRAEQILILTEQLSEAKGLLGSISLNNGISGTLYKTLDAWLEKNP